MPKCAVPDCKVTVESRFLMCRDCWHLVPAPLRRRVNATWKKVTMRNDRQTLTDYQTARQAAVDAAVAAGR